MTRETAELEAEAVAYVVCRHFGLDVGVRASRYIALWQGDGKALRASLGRIVERAGLSIPDGFRMLSYVQGKYCDVGGNNIRACIDLLPNALRRFGSHKDSPCARRKDSPGANAEAVAA